MLNTDADSLTPRLSLQHDIVRHYEHRRCAAIHKNNKMSSKTDGTSVIQDTDSFKPSPRRGEGRVRGSVGEYFNQCKEKQLMPKYNQPSPPTPSPAGEGAIF